MKIKRTVAFEKGEKQQLCEIISRAPGPAAAKKMVVDEMGVDFAVATVAVDNFYDIVKAKQS